MKKNVSKLMTLVVVMITCISLLSMAASASAYSLGESLLTDEELANITKKGTGDYTFSGNDLTLSGGDANAWTYAFVQEKTYEDSVIRMHLDKWTDGGVLFRLTVGDAGLNGYMVGTDGVNIYLAKYVNNQFGLLMYPENVVEGGAPFAAPYTQLSDAMWTITVVGDVISVYIDDSETPLIQAKDSGYTSGGIAFQLKNAKDGGEAVKITDFGVYAYSDKAPDGPAKTGDMAPVKAVAIIATAGLLMGITAVACPRKKNEQ